jgi:hypothetical protein
MFSDKREVVEVQSSSKMTLVASLFMLATAGLGYVLGDMYLKSYNVSKSAFICTKIEQVGKNMDDVVCVQYTHQKHQKEAVALNKLSEL